MIFLEFKQLVTWPCQWIDIWIVKERMYSNLNDNQSSFITSCSQLPLKSQVKEHSFHLLFVACRATLFHIYIFLCHLREYVLYMLQFRKLCYSGELGQLMGMAHNRMHTHALQTNIFLKFYKIL